MKSIEAIWTNGQIVPSEPVDWPEGSKLLVEPLPAADKAGLTEEEWRDEPEAIADWIAAVKNIQPMVWAEGEREEFERYRKEYREFNLDAVRKQMQAMPDDDAS
jgi:hypothetical protein